MEAATLYFVIYTIVLMKSVPGLLLGLCAAALGLLTSLILTHIFGVSTAVTIGVIGMLIAIATYKE